MAEDLRLQFLRGNNSQNDNYTGADGELTVDYESLDIRMHDGSTKGGHRVGGNLAANINLSVGPGGDYAELSDALKYLSTLAPMVMDPEIQVFVGGYITLKAGYVITKPVAVLGVNLGWVEIRGEDEETPVDATNFDDGVAIFRAERSGVHPRINQKFRLLPTTKKIDGLRAFGAGSVVEMYPNNAILDITGHALFASRGGTVTTPACEISAIRDTFTVIFANENAIVNARASTMTKVGSGYLIQCQRTSNVDVTDAYINASPDARFAGTGGASIVSADGIEIEELADLGRQGAATISMQNATVHKLNNGGISTFGTVISLRATSISNTSPVAGSVYSPAFQFDDGSRVDLRNTVFRGIDTADADGNQVPEDWTHAGLTLRDGTIVNMEGCKIKRFKNPLRSGGGCYVNITTLEMDHFDVAMQLSASTVQGQASLTINDYSDGLTDQIVNIQSNILASEHAALYRANIPFNTITNNGLIMTDVDNIPVT